MSGSNPNLDHLADEFEAQWQGLARPNLVEFLERVEKTFHDALARMLIAIDAEYRMKHGEQVQAEDYAALGAELQPAVEFCLGGLFENPDHASQASDPGETQEPRQVPANPVHGARRRSTAASMFSKSQQIGPYKLLQKLGEGGMGMVWMADQEKPLQRRVALKVIKAGLDNKQVIARFEAERQALAMMDHPNIARVLDAGTTDAGQPYFVMELVHGIPFTKYCDQHKLSINERLELFIPVCKAVQHAHQKGIIHRDLKPSNVLVSLYDGKPIPKVIDFGLAKALEHTTHLTDKTMFTEFGQVVGTLQYMSPEQAEMNQLDIDTRTDIYSLGVMLYELLTGSTPIDADTLKKNAILQVLATIRETDPPRPSHRLSSITHEAANGISDQRRIEVNKLKTLLRGELDWIVMKALEKDRTRRYETAINFADDLTRYLCGDIVTARPPSTGYRVRKYIRRNKGLVASVVSIVTLLIAGIIATTWFAFQAEDARKVADSKTKEVRGEKARVEEQRNRANIEAENAKLAESQAEAEKTRAEHALEETKATLARSDFFLANARWNENRVGDARALLDRIPERYRNFEWYLDQRLYQGSAVTLYGHQDAVTSVAFSPDGARIVSGSSDFTLKLWDAATGQELRTLKGHTDHVTSVAFSPDGARIVSGSEDKTLKLWEAATGQELRTLKGHTDHVTSVAFSPDGARIVSGSEDKTLKLWEAATGQELRTLQGHTEWVSSVAFSPDGARIVSGSNDFTLKLWDAATGQELRTLKGHTDHVSSVAFSPDGARIVSGSFAYTLKLWDAATGQELRTLKGHTDVVDSVAFSPDGARIVSGSGDGRFQVWDAATGQELRTLQGHTQRVNSVAFSPDGARIVSGSNDNTLKLWDAATGQELRTLQGHTDDVKSVAFSPDGARIVSGSGDGRFQLWDAATGQELRTLQGHTHVANSVAFSPDGARIVSGSSDFTLKLWDAATGQELRTLQGHTDDVNSVAFSPDGARIVSGSDDKTLKLWDAATGQELRTLQGHTHVVNSVAFSPDGARIVSGSYDKTLKLWDAATGQELRTLQVHSNGVSSVAFSPDGARIVSGSSDFTLKLWDAATGQELRTLKGHTDYVTSVAFSPDGARIVSGSWDKTLKLWDAATGQELRTLKGHTYYVTSVAFSPDGARIVSGSSDKTLKLWDAAMDQELHMLQGHTDRVDSVAFSTDGARIVSGSWDKTLKLWDAATGQELRTLKGHTEGVSSVAFSPDGARIVSGSYDKTLKLWDAATGQELRTLNGHTDYVTSVAFSPDGARIVSGSDDKTLKLWDAATGQELRTLKGHTVLVTSSSFSPDGTRFYSQTLNGEMFVWDSQTGTRLEGEPMHFFDNTKTVSNDGRWLVTSSGSNVLLVDLEFKNQALERTFRASKVMPNPLWHREQATNAESDGEWFAATFHRAWIMKARPELASSWDNLHAAHENWLEAQKDGEHPPLPMIVRQMLELPRGDTVTEEEQAEMDAAKRAELGKLNDTIWNQVKVPNDQTIELSLVDQFRSQIAINPRGTYLNTLGTAEYRLGNFQAAIYGCTDSIELMPSELNLPGPHPIDFAVIAMSHLKLGNNDEADKFKNQFDEAMKHEKFKDDPACLCFAKEVKALFDGVIGEKQDQEPQVEPTQESAGDKQDEQ